MMGESGNVARVFIGSSRESLTVAEYLQVALDDHFETTIWDEGVFGLTQETLQSLLAASRNHDYAVLVLTADDLVTKRGETHPAPRDNTVFEFGLFLGALGADRTFMLVPRDARIDLPSDLLSVTAARFRERKDGNLQAAIRPAAVKIRDAILQHVDTGAPISQADHGKKGGIAPPVRSAAGGLRAEAPATQVLKYLGDLLDSVASGRAGVAPHLLDEDDFRTWARNLLAMLQDLFADRQEDVYAIWLRPTPGNSSKLSSFLSNNWQEHDHYQFSKGKV